MNNPPSWLEVESAQGVDTIMLRRGACYGICPVYAITLFRDGTASYLGEYFVKRVGKWHGTYPVEEFGRLADLIEQSGFYGWGQCLAGGATCLPDRELAVTRGGARFSVTTNGYDLPPHDQIGREIDRIGLTIEWQRSEEGGPAGLSETWSR